MTKGTQKAMAAESDRSRGWVKFIGDMLGIVLMVVVAKAAIAEPYYVPSGSMEPTLLIGDELLAMKYPYGYSTASLPLSIDLPSSGRILGALPQRGDVLAEEPRDDARGKRLLHLGRARRQHRAAGNRRRRIRHRPLGRRLSQFRNQGGCGGGHLRAGLPGGQALPRVDLCPARLYQRGGPLFSQRPGQAAAPAAVLHLRRHSLAAA